MTGIVDDAGRAILGIMIVTDSLPNGTEVDVWIDTGFTGEIVLPSSLIHQLGLVQSGSINAILANGSQIQLEIYSCKIQWFGTVKNLEVIANDGDIPLLGCELRIDYFKMVLSILPST